MRHNSTGPTGLRLSEVLPLLTATEDAWTVDVRTRLTEAAHLSRGAISWLVLKEAHLRYAFWRYGQPVP
jgi:hypothetical protein